MTKTYNCILTPEELEDKIKELIDYCDTSGTPATDYVVTDLIGISDNTIQYYRHYQELEIPENATEDEKEIIRKKKKLGESLKKLDRYRSHFWQMQGLKDPKTIGIANFALKQQSNGGWTDKQGENRQPVEITVKMGGKEASGAFD